jgi:F-type H+-transporting ATPase subunit gamma
MPSTREMRTRISSVKSISQVTRALETVSASKVRKAVTALDATRPYATKAWQVLTHIANQPGRASLHPLLAGRSEVRSALVIVISSNRGLAGEYNTNVIRFAIREASRRKVAVHYVAVGRKGRDLLLRRRQQIVAEFSNVPDTPSFMEVSAIGHLAVAEFLEGVADEVYLVYTNYVNTVEQETVIRKLLPLETGDQAGRVQDFEHQRLTAAYIYEPAEDELLHAIVPRFTALQIYQAILESQASEHAARMVAMSNATENATELTSHLQLEYNKLRQQTITSDLLDIAAGAEALVR